MYSRHLASLLRESLQHARVLLLNGARQTGKTTLVQSLLGPDFPATYQTFDDIATLSAARTDPAGFIRQFTGPVILDEVQRVPEIFLPIKMAVDANPQPGSFVLTGSANVLSLPKLADSLAGRLEILSLWPLAQSEIVGSADNFIDRVWTDPLQQPPPQAVERADLFERLLRGGYPAALSREAGRWRQQWFASYVTTLLERDVRDLSQVRDLTEFPRLLQALAARTSTLLNLNDVSRTVGIQHETLRRYTALLKAIWLVVELPAWSGNLGKRLVKTPKVTLNDTGLISHVLGINRQRLEREPLLLGQLVESFVVMELYKHLTWSEQLGVRMFHYRDQSGAEVDIVLEAPSGEIVGVEVKATATPNAADLAGLKALQAAVGKRFRRGILLHTGTTVTHHSNDLYFWPLSSLWQ